jgi:hypothetical protein
VYLGRDRKGENHQNGNSKPEQAEDSNQRYAPLDKFTYRHRLSCAFFRRFVETDSAVGTIFGGRNHPSKEWLKQHSAAAGTSSQHSHQRGNCDHHYQPKYKNHEENYPWQSCKANTAARHDYSPDKLNSTDQCSPLFDILPDRHSNPSATFGHLLIEAYATV